MSHSGQSAEIIISADKHKLDIEFIFNFLTNSYWAKGRTSNEVEKTIEHSLCFGIYINHTLIGFAYLKNPEKLMEMIPSKI